MPTKWYVNLPENPDQQQGPKIFLTLKPTGDNIPSNAEMAWKVETNLDNLNEVDEDVSFDVGDGAGTRKTKTEIDDDKFKVSLKVPPYGNEKYMIYCHRVGIDNEDDEWAAAKSKDYISRRRLYYMLHHAKGVKKPTKVMSYVAELFEDAGIELQELGSSEVILPDPCSPVTIAQKRQTLTEIPEEQRGQTLRLVFAKTMGIDEVVDTTVSISDGDVDSSKPLEIPVELNGDQAVILKQNETKRPTWLKVENSSHYAPLVTDNVGALFKNFNAKATVEPHPNEAHKAIVKITDLATVELLKSLTQMHETSLEEARDSGYPDDYDASYHVFVPNKPYKDEVSIRIKMIVVGDFGGGGSGPNISLPEFTSPLYTNESQEAQDKALASIVAHEIGHAVGLVPDKLNYNGKDNDHEDAYTKHGGQGPHCKYRTKPVNNKDAGPLRDASESDTYEVYMPQDNKESEVCIMYAATGKDMHKRGFCPQCMEFLRALPLTKQSLKAQDWHKAW